MGEFLKFAPEALRVPETYLAWKAVLFSYKKGIEKVLKIL